MDLTLLLAPCYTVFRRSLPVGSAPRPAKREAVATRRRERLPSNRTAFVQQQCALTFDQQWGRGLTVFSLLSPSHVSDFYAPWASSIYKSLANLWDHCFKCIFACTFSSDLSSLAILLRSARHYYLNRCLIPSIQWTNCCQHHGALQTVEALFSPIGQMTTSWESTTPLRAAVEAGPIYPF